MTDVRTLADNWLMQASAGLTVHGETLSTHRYDPSGWMPATVPGSVMAGLVANGRHPDPYIGLNMRDLPGYKLGKTTHFSHHYMPDGSPFRRTWWYRTDFDLPADHAGRHSWLRFKGINYRADIWLNGRRIADAGQIAGTYRGHDLDVTRTVSSAHRNVLALEISAPQPDDLALTFIDWNPVPPDDGMGIWQPVMLYTTGPVAVQHPAVSCELDTESLGRAALTIEADLINTTDQPVSVRLEARIESIICRRRLRLAPFARRRVRFTPRAFPQLILRAPRLWWPYQMGEPHLYRLDLTCEADGAPSDAAAVTFGIRDVRSRINEHGARLFTVNGRDLLIRGAAWVPDLMLRQSRAREGADIAMLKTMHLNAIRFEGKLGSDELWDLCDREGILVLAGWPCCNHWERWRDWKPGDAAVAAESLRWQLRRLRNHPSLIAWLYGSDFPPPEPVERMYLDILKELHPTLPTLSSAAAFPSALRGPTGVRMTGPNKYVPPIYWYDTARPGHAASFNLETCPDSCVPVCESLQKFLHGEQCIPGSPAWNHHAGLGHFADTDEVNEAVAARYGEPADVRAFARQAQVLGYEAWRAMYEAYARNYPRATGVIGWMLNSAWPSVFWQLYDYYLQPTGAFYGTQKACEPLHLQYAYDDASIWGLNLNPAPAPDLTAQVTVRTLTDAAPVFEQRVPLNLEPFARRRILTLPTFDAAEPVRLLFLLLSRNGTPVARNVYWLAATPDRFADEPRKFHWPLRQHADLSALRHLPPADIEHASDCTRDPSGWRVHVTLRNRGATVAFFLWLKLIDARSGDLLAPVYWSENGVTLQPGETWTVTARTPVDVQASQAEVIVEQAYR